MTPEVHRETILEATGAQARIARVYAEALTAAAAKKGEVDLVGDELAEVVHGLLSELTGHPVVREFFRSGVIGRKAMQPVLHAAFEHSSTETFRNFIEVLNQNRRLGLLRAIHAAYEKLRDTAAGRVRVRIASAVPLNDEIIAALRATMAERLQAEPILDLVIDPNLLGGLVIQVGDRVFDSSVRSRLETLRTHLMMSGTHGA